MDFESAVAALVKKYTKMTIVSGQVKEVRDDDCDVSREGMPDLLEVRFKSVLNSTESEFKVTPKKGSTVLCGMIEGDEAENVIIAYTEIDVVSIKIDQLEFVCSGDGVKVNNQGENLKKVFNDLQDKYGDLCDEIVKIVVSVGVSPDVPAIAALKQSVVSENKMKLNKILIE